MAHANQITPNDTTPNETAPNENATRQERKKWPCADRVATQTTHPLRRVLPQMKTPRLANDDMPNEDMNHAPPVEGYRLNHLLNEPPPPVNDNTPAKRGLQMAAGTPDEPHTHRTHFDRFSSEPTNPTNPQSRQVTPQNKHVRTATHSLNETHEWQHDMRPQKPRTNSTPTSAAHAPQPAPTANRKPATLRSENM
ncbi:hypothetical protein BS47DRAFT_1358280 [Hydnum rufescens UP504]|uniref:Uncharacterized protein n=1 Tax=Hydnum rufescens UP504 TaxID=1448309 RepID=A0A9P6B8Z0_9AGAM|nr:hypothetical protein BS47DRAFT_1358280 [Hydnum rufescens UP504]